MIHKSQELEYPAVAIPVLTQHYAMLQRNLLYTGITRGKRLDGLGRQAAAAQWPLWYGTYLTGDDGQSSGTGWPRIPISTRTSRGGS